MKNLFNIHKKNKKLFILLVSMTSLLTISIAGTLAYLLTVTDPVVNTMNPSFVPPTVVEEIEDDVKKQVSIENSGDVSAYIRAMVVVNWIDNDESDDKDHLYGTAPVLNINYKMTIPADSTWVQGKDGYYYYKKPVAAGDQTENLITNAKQMDSANQPDGYNLSIEIIAQTIQADGEDSEGNKPVVLAWGSEQGGSVTSVDSDGNLDIDTSSN